MKKINMLSPQFSHDISSTVNQKCDYFEWDFFSKKNDISFYIDFDMFKGINEKNDGKIKFLWLLESHYFNNNSFELVQNHLDAILDTYELIFTYNESLLSLHSKFKWVPAMGSWIKSPSVHEKTKLISMITSNKQMTPQQIFRCNYAESVRNTIDVFGRGFFPIENKEDALNDYMFSICVENDTRDTYFTEKILDCFATGTIPVYKGTKNILNHFNPDGILFLDDISLNDLTKELYVSKINAINDNFERVKSYICPENFIYINYIKKYL
jgi:hypothetical protein